MLTAWCWLTEDQLLCSICQNVFTDPVSTPCGHNFCRACVTDNVNVDCPFQCPVCQKMFYPKPELQVNALIAEMVEVFRRSATNRTDGKAVIFCVALAFLFLFSSQIQSDLPLTEVIGSEQRAEESIQEMIQDIRLKMEQVLPLVQIWALRSVEINQNEHKQKQRTTEVLMEELQQHIWEQKKKLLSAPQMEQVFGEVMKKEIPKLLLRAELMRVQRYRVDVTLDPDTAHPELIVSPDGKQVICCGSNRNLPDKLKRFTFNVYVLGKQSFSSGRFYFEVQVKGKMDWTFGVAKESISRKKGVTLRPQSGFWSISLRNGTDFRALSEPPVRLALQSPPEKVGVFVDYEEGVVFFYDVDAAVFIYSFTGCFFTERLYPFFDPSLSDAAPLIISPVKHNEM